MKLICVYTYINTCYVCIYIYVDVRMTLIITIILIINDKRNNNSNNFKKNGIKIIIHDVDVECEIKKNEEE